MHLSKGQQGLFKFLPMALIFIGLISGVPAHGQFGYWDNGDDSSWFKTGKEMQAEYDADQEETRLWKEEQNRRQELKDQRAELERLKQQMQDEKQQATAAQQRQRQQEQLQKEQKEQQLRTERLLNMARGKATLPRGHAPPSAANLPMAPENLKVQAWDFDEISDGGDPLYVSDGSKWYKLPVTPDKIEEVMKGIVSSSPGSVVRFTYPQGNSLRYNGIEAEEGAAQYAPVYAAYKLENGQKSGTEDSVVGPCEYVEDAAIGRGFSVPTGCDKSSFQVRTVTCKSLAGTVTFVSTCKVDGSGLSANRCADQHMAPLVKNAIDKHPNGNKRNEGTR
jgi:hypothetical protein